MDKYESSSITTTRGTRVRQIYSGVLLIVAVIPFGGCRICADCDEGAYGAYGGAWQRTLRDSGRVGSIFDPAGGLAPDLVSRDTPKNPDELERQRQEAMGEADPDQADDPPTEMLGDEVDPLDKAEDLRQRKLDDIEEEREDELRKKDLDDIEIRVIPGRPMPPELG